MLSESWFQFPRKNPVPPVAPPTRNWSSPDFVIEVLQFGHTPV
jgi:hypothetical protein